jgi:ketopantoate hydroxymethyltransferase
MMSRRVRVTHFNEKKKRGEKIAMLTAYDATMSRLLDRAGVDALLVGDSLGMVVLGYDSTLPVTIADVVYHTRAVRHGAEHALVIADMPFLSYHVSMAQAVRNAGRLIQEGGAAAVKLEGGRPVLEVVRRLVDIGIPVMGHLGLQPQSVHQSEGMSAVRPVLARPSGSSLTRVRYRRRERLRSCSNAFQTVLLNTSPRNSRSRRSASGPALIATGKSSSATTWSACAITSRRHS